MTSSIAEQALVSPDAPRVSAVRRGRPPKSEVLAEDRRSQILAAATRRFAKVGFLGTTVRQIADDVNILSGSLYHHFTNKDEMLNEIVSDTVTRMRDAACVMAAWPGSAEQRLASLIHVNLVDLKDNLEVHAILYRERAFFRNRAEFDYVVQAKKTAYHAWEKILHDGIREGVFRSDLDTFLTISTTVRMLNAAADWGSPRELGRGDARTAWVLCAPCWMAGETDDAAGEVGGGRSSAVDERSYPPQGE